MIKPLDQHIVNILSVYAQADRMDKEKGATAYKEYNRMLQHIGLRFCVDFNKVCAIFSMLSPNATYASNITSAEAMLHAYATSNTIDSFQVATYLQNKRKAWRLLESEGDGWLDEIETWFPGKKTRAFFSNICWPHLQSQFVVVDGHMYSVWMLKQFGMREAKVGNGRTYDRIANDIREAARIAGVPPSVMQATCWFTWKRINRISFDVGELQLKLWPKDKNAQTAAGIT